jgi:hypothetical protein
VRCRSQPDTTVQCVDGTASNQAHQRRTLRPPSPDSIPPSEASHHHNVIPLSASVTPLCALRHKCCHGIVVLKSLRTVVSFGHPNWAPNRRVIL